MSHMEMEYARILARARKLAGLARKAGKRIDADDLTQKTFQRFYEAGLDARVDSTKGTALKLLYSVLGFVYLEALRAENRSRKSRSILGHERIQLDPLSILIVQERMAFIRKALSGQEGEAATLTEREREALVRVYGTLFNKEATDKADGNDRASACRARWKLRDRAKRCGHTE